MIDGLQLGDEIIVAISSSTHVGESLVRSTPLSVRVGIPKRSTPPSNLRYRHLPPRAVVLTWQASSLLPEIIDHYDVSILQLTADGEKLKRFRYDALFKLKPLLSSNGSSSRKLISNKIVNHL